MVGLVSHYNPFVSPDKDNKPHNDDQVGPENRYNPSCIFDQQLEKPCQDDRDAT